MIDRRKAIVYLAAGGISLVSPASFCATDTADLSDPEQLLEAYVRLSGAMDDRLVIWWMEGTRYGVVNAKAKALYGMKAGLFHRFYRQPDNTYKIAFFELTYYTDLQTGALLREFDNPYTGKTNKVRHVRLGPEIRLLNQNGLTSPDNPMVHDYHSSLGPALIKGDMLWIPTSVEATIKFPKPTAPEILLNIYTTILGSLTDALNTQLKSAPCSLEFHNVLKWEPWMNMSDHPGHLMTTASGQKLEALDQLPAAYLQMAQEVHGKYIADPVETLRRQSNQILGR